VAVQAARAPENAKTALASAGATVSDVVQWTVLFVEGVDLGAAYGSIAPVLASDEPALVTGARVAGRGVPGALVEISAVAAVLPQAGVRVRLVEAHGVQLPAVILPAAHSGTADAALPAAVERQ
jgi:hypothetical protein